MKRIQNKNSLCFIFVRHTRHYNSNNDWIALQIFEEKLCSCWMDFWKAMSGSWDHKPGQPCWKVDVMSSLPLRYPCSQSVKLQTNVWVVEFLEMLFCLKLWRLSWCVRPVTLNAKTERLPLSVRNNIQFVFIN